ncbi:methionine synthase [Patescibacteria group bacterium]|nr:methionine synthase [Patescibacteria group bacterium]
MNQPDIKNLIQEKVIVFDGAMGTSIQGFNLAAADFGGHEGCNEYLVISQPTVIKKIHASFLAVGCDVIETNTFGANGVVLADYGLEDKVYEINKAAAGLAKSVTKDFSTASQKRYVAGSIGPGTKLPSLGQVGFDRLLDVYYEQTLGLLDGGVDLLQIETCQDMLQIKAAWQGVAKAQQERDKALPVIVQVTIESNKKMLLGTEMLAVITTFQPYNLFALGINCGTGPAAMKEQVAVLACHSPFNISVLPNAGLPKLVGESQVYDLSPEALAQELTGLVKDYGVNIIGGCCGTTPQHLRAVVEAVKSKRAKRREYKFIPSFSSLYGTQEMDVEPKPLIVGERTNATGSKEFREHLLDNDLDGMVDIALEQQAEGAHLIDVSVGYAGRDETKDLPLFVSKLNTVLKVPLSIDTTNVEALTNGLKQLAGRPLINSINLEDGGTRAKKVLRLAQDFGAALICLTIDEQGMALTTERKIAVAQKIYDLATKEFDIKPVDLFFDPLTFTLASGDKKYQDAARATLEAIKAIKQKFPQSQTILGVSNVSYGLKPRARKMLNSVFLQEALQAGLDAAILHAAKIVPFNKISRQDVTLAQDLIYNKKRPGCSPLEKIISRYEKSVPQEENAVQWDKIPVEEKLIKHIVEGRKKGLKDTLEQSLKKYQPLEIVNNYLLNGIKEVGELFGAGKLQLPFVLRSAETMKAAVSLLEPHMPKSYSDSLCSVALATVKGDVHDIGKNLVDIIFSNNGYKIHNIGVDQSAEDIIAAIKKHRVDYLGLSGLLVKSTVIMKDLLTMLNKHKINIPVLCGGAALTPDYTEKVLNKAYQGEVYYAQDAFAAMKIIGDHAAAKQSESSPAKKIVSKANSASKKSSQPKSTTDKISYRQPIPQPPFWGHKIIKDIPLTKVLPYLDKNLLFKQQWQFQQTGMSAKKVTEAIKLHAEPALTRIVAKTKKEKLLDLKVAYGFYPCYSDNNKLIILDPRHQTKKIVEFEFPAQVRPPHLSLSKYFRPRQKDKYDVVSFYIVTVGARASEESKDIFQKDEYTDYLLWHGFTVKMAEALAKFIHKRIRVELGIAGSEPKKPMILPPNKYQGQRYSFGYSVCPNLADQQKLFQLLQPEEIGISLSETYQLVPEQSTSGLVVYHPAATYFSLS